MCKLGALRAHQRITTATMSQASQASTVRPVRTNELQLARVKESRAYCGYAPCAPTNYNMYEVFKTPARLRGALRAHQRITTPYVSSGTKTEWVRSTRTNELQPVDTNDFDVLHHGTPRAHPRITTWRMTYNPAITARVCLMRAHELQRALSVENHSVPKGTPRAHP